ncbi:spore germination protein [Bacillus sp. FJAT-44742]|uniref:spore germination protein n=1 Tax=Bacillus sp. FJAT-44742 TaxID=2014005 RepID=UPI001E4FD62F|nr:spore germination protein [Bacillus sp. FJAT-44742]
MFLQRFFKRKQPGEQRPPESIKEGLKRHELQSNDFKKQPVYTSSGFISLYYFETLTAEEKIQNNIILPLKEKNWSTYEDISNIVSVEETSINVKFTDIEKALLEGSVFIHKEENDAIGLLAGVPNIQERDVGPPEVEFSVAGPQEAFVETLDTNIHLIRKRLPVSTLYIKKMEIGSLTKTSVAVLYIKDVADEDNVNTVIQRISELETDQVLDSNSLAQMIQDHTYSIFPQFINTERPDRVAAALTEGKVVFMANGSPEGITTPATLIEFFSSLEDYYLPWQIASFVRLLRFAAVSFSVLATPVYVAVLTFHYELIPKELLTTLVLSRSNIPFPPIIEAIFLELTIELLREAGARLPTKVGQTIGIVGGIVIGQASVEAGLTSNILLIVVALAALASFTTPVYQMGNTIRVIRFPFLLGAVLMGGIGIVVCLMFTIAHLIKLNSLGRPYLAPLYPLRLNDWKDAFLRLPFNKLTTRPQQSRTKERQRIPFQKAMQKKDIDE